ncbi:hypothetical protein [Brumimicrobium sp.]|uniref:hypothetical protein n=1 Tax=Brumimicrobium sp. TaxID=2029867 RepID=UPI003A930BF0
MLKEITIKSSNHLPTDLGQVAECMLFYERVNLICNFGFFIKLINSNQVYSFIDLMKTEGLNVYISDNVFAFGNSKIIPDWNNIVLTSNSAHLSQFERLERMIVKTTGRRGYGRRLTSKIIDNSSPFENKAEVMQHVLADFEDNVYMKRAIAYSANEYIVNGKIESELVEFDLKKINGGILLKTNLNTEFIESKEGQRAFDNITILGNVLDTRADANIATEFGSDISTSNINTLLLEYKVNDILTRSSKNRTSLNNFSKLYLPNGKPIRNAINSNERSLTEFMRLLEKADKFKSWLNNFDGDKDILTEYYNAVSKESWVDKLPAKGFRWTFFTGAGILSDIAASGGLGTLIGIGLSLGDTFLLDKMIKGWKPNSFIDNEVAKFLNYKE